MPPALAQLIPERSMLTLGGPSSRAVMSPEGLPVGGGSAVRAQVLGAGTGAVWSGAPQWLVSLGQGPGTAHLCAHLCTGEHSGVCTGSQLAREDWAGGEQTCAVGTMAGTLMLPPLAWVHSPVPPRLSP